MNMNTYTSTNQQTASSQYLPPILPTSKSKRDESALTRQRYAQEKKGTNNDVASRRNSIATYRTNSLPPTSNIYDADVFTIHHDSQYPKGTNDQYVKSVVETDMYSMNSTKNGVYSPDYVLNSKPIRFQEEDSEDNTWIRVFGYSPEDVSMVMEELQRCGYISEIRSTASNYMYIRYYTQMDVEKAVAFNGKLICGHYIGVVRCKAEDVGEASDVIQNRNHSTYMDRRDYMLKENEIYKKAPVKRLSVCTMLSNWLFGI